MNKLLRAAFMMIFTGSLMFTLNTGVYAEGMEKTKDEWMQKREARKAEMYEKLGVTEEQKQKLAEHRKTHREDSTQNREVMKSKQKALNDAIKAGDVEKAKSLNEEIKTIKAQMQDKRLEGVLGVREILTEEQFSKFMELREERGKEFKGKKEFKKFED